VLAVAANRRVRTEAGPISVDALPALIPADAWQRHSAGAGAHGPRLYSWAWLRLNPEDDADTGVHHLLIRRNDATGEYAYLRCHRARCRAHPGRRRRPTLAHRGILSNRQGPDRTRSAPSAAREVLVPLDHTGHARPRVPGCGHRHRTRRPPTPTGLIALTVNEFADSSTPCCWSPTTPCPHCWLGHDGDGDTNTEPDFPTNDTRTEDPINGCSTSPQRRSAALRALRQRPRVRGARRL
jgi:hypothetical protein